MQDEIMSNNNPTLTKLAQDMDEINGKSTPAADAGAVSETTDRLDLQSAIDAKAKEADTKNLFGNNYYKINPPLITSFNLPSPDATSPSPAPSGEKAGFAAATTTVPQQTQAPKKAQPVGMQVSEEDNNACLARLIAIFELSEDIQHRALLRDLALVQDHLDQYTVPENCPSAILKTTGNVAVVTKGLVEFQETSPLKASDALEAAAIALNDKKSYPDGVELKGNMRDRYMLMLAAQRVGLRVTNPVSADTLNPDDKTAIDAEFFLHVTLNAKAMESIDQKSETTPVTTDVKEKPASKLSRFLAEPFHVPPMG